MAIISIRFEYEEALEGEQIHEALKKLGLDLGNADLGNGCICHKENGKLVCEYTNVPIGKDKDAQ